MKILDIILEDAGKVYAIGDSLAVGIAQHNPVAGSDAKGGIPPSEVLARVKKFASSNNAKGSTVILGTGAPNGPAQINLVNQQIDVLKDAGVTVIILGAGPKIPNIDAQLKTIASQHNVKYIGPLGSIDPSMAKGDGIHPSGRGYKAIFQIAMGGSAPAVAPAPSTDKPDSAQKVDTNATVNKINVPNGRVNADIADIQKVLLALGYQLPKHGVDGVRGPETSTAIKQFQADNGLTVDGDPGPETVGALNKLIDSKGVKFTKSTDADVKKQNATAFTGGNPLPDLKMDAVTKGKVGEVLNLIASKESAGFYDIMNGGRRFPEILDMTLAEVYNFQKRHADRVRKISSAAGRYQIMDFNMFPYGRKAGLNPQTDKFSPANQDKMGIVFLRECGLEAWLNGKMSNEAFLDKISGVWAAFADSKGHSRYAGDGYNKQGVPPKAVLAALDDIQNKTA